MSGEVESPGGHALYGLNVLGLDVAPDDVPPPAHWDRWTVEQRLETSDDRDGMTVTNKTARVGVPGAGEILLDRARRSIVYSRRRLLAPQALLHPGLVPAAAIVAWWMGRVSVHASAVLVDGGVWGLLADREGGKSTTAALLAARGCALFTDDMLIVDGDVCFAGPSSVDLREQAGQSLGGRSLGVVGERARWRKTLDRGAIEAPLAGFVELVWASHEATVTELPAKDRIAVLDRQVSLPVTGAHLLALADRPMLRFARPRSLDAAGGGIDVLEQALLAQKGRAWSA